MPFPLAIPLAISAFSSIFGAKKQADSAKDAAKLQAASADRAAGVARQVYLDQMRGMEPYAAAGRGAASTLGALMTAGVPFTPDRQQALANQHAAPPSWMTSAAPPAPSGGTLGSLAGMPASGGMVRLQAPDGSVRMVPGDQVGPLLARGARRVG